MSRTFAYLALFAMTALVATMLLGFMLREGDIRDKSDESAQINATVHRLAGMGTGVVVLLVYSIAVTYFIGTSRWIREVSETYHLDATYVRRSTQLKRRTFPLTVLGMLTAVGIVALGGAADPAASVSLDPIGGISWGSVHLVGAGLGLCIIGYGFLQCWSNIATNNTVINEVVAEVQQIRRSRGLDVS